MQTMSCERSWSAPISGLEAELLAEEIAAARPDLVGLQEVALWRHGPMQLDKIGQLNATDVDYDFLAILLSDLASRGTRYEVASAQQESDVEAPAFTGNPLSGTAGSAEDVRLTDRDVILLRDDSGIRIEGRGGGHYSDAVQGPAWGRDLSLHSGVRLG